MNIDWNCSTKDKVCMTTTQNAGALLVIASELLSLVGILLSSSKSSSTHDCKEKYLASTGLVHLVGRPTLAMAIAHLLSS